MIKWYKKFSLFMGVLGQAAVYVQAYVLFKNQSAQDVSLGATIITFASLLNWLIYGWILKDYIIVLSNVTGIIGVTFVIFGIMLYR